MKFYQIITFSLLMIGITVYHILTLSVSPIVWTDEVCLNSMTIDFLKHHTYYFTADPIWSEGKQALIYGPVYFFLNSKIISLLGNSIFSARLLSMLSGLIVLVWFYFQANKNEDKKYLLPVFIAFLCDLFYGACMHNSRMDLTAMMFFLLGINSLMLSRNKGENQYLFSIISGVLFSAALLTTPRIALFSLALIPLLFQKFYIRNFLSIEIKSYIIIISIVIISFLSWIFYSFGSIESYREYFLFVYNYSPSHNDGKIKIATENLVLFSITATSVFIATLLSRKFILNAKVLFCIIWVLSFYLFIRDVGPYAIFVIPIYYLLVFLSLEEIAQHYKIKPVSYVLISILMVSNIGIFCLKSFTLYGQASARNYVLVNNFIKENIPTGAKVCGDELYYYAALNNNNPFVLMKSYQGNDNKQSKFKSLYEKVEQNRRVDFDYDYLIVSNRISNRISSLTAMYLNNSKLIKMAEYHTQPSPLLKWLSDKKLYSASSEYSGIIFKRIKN